MLEEYDDSDSLPLDDPEPEELSRFFFEAFLSTRAGCGELGFFRFRDGIGDASFFSIVRWRTFFERNSIKN